MGLHFILILITLNNPERSNPDQSDSVPHHSLTVSLNTKFKNFKYRFYENFSKVCALRALSYFCLSVCLLARLRQNYWTDFDKTLYTNSPQVSEESIKFWRGWHNYSLWGAHIPQQQDYVKTTGRILTKLYILIALRCPKNPLNFGGDGTITVYGALTYLNSKITSKLLDGF